MILRPVKVLSILFTLISSLVYADEVKELKVVKTKAEQGLLEAWNINQQEYERYLYIKNNLPRGYYTPKAHPLYYLGLEARTDAEKEKYARAIAQMEYENAEKVQAFSKLIQKFQFEMYASEGVMDISSVANYQEQSVKTAKLELVSSLFVDSSCVEACSQALKEELTRIYKGSSKQLHIVFPKNTKADSINRWARVVGLPHELNKRDVIIIRYQKDDENFNSFPHVTSKFL